MKPETGNPELEIRPLDLASIRARLGTLRGVEYWRCLEELAESEEFKTLLHQEFPRHATAWMDSLDRRGFLKVMGASLALAGLGGCMSPAPAPPDEKIVPYVNQPEEIIPGRPLFFASAMPLSGFGRGVLVESHEGRPTKIEGNPDHPGSLGSSDVFMQASALVFYDPDRSRVLTNAGIISTWNRFFAALNAELETQRLTEGAGLRILTETVTSPTLAHQLNTLLKKLPKAKWHQYEPAGRDHVYEGARLAFGEGVDTRYRLDKANVILSIDADFLFLGAGSLRYARDFADRRRVRGPKAEMNRLYVVESTPSVTGSMADHRLPLSPNDIVAFAKLVAKSLGVELPGEVPAAPAPQGNWISALVRDLQKHRGNSLVIAGDPQPPIVHALAHAMNLALGNVGNTVVHTEPVAANPMNQNDSLRELARDMEANAVQVLIMIGGNPAYTAPADLNFSSLLVKSNFSVHLSLYDDETSALCHWHIPEAHYLESWSDVRAFDGTASIIQPLIAPLYEGRTAHEVLATLMGQPGRTSYEIVRDYWKQQHPGPDFETFWRTAVHDGIVHGTEAPAKQTALKRDLSAWAAPGQEQAGEKAGSGKTEKNDLEVLFRLDPTIYDGCFANNGWLQETPKPLTKLTWDNAVLVSPATAERLGLNYRIGTTGGEHGTVYGDVVELEYAGRKVRGTAWILPGQTDDCVTLHLGYGRTRAGRVGNKTGFNVNSIRTSDAPWHASGLQIRKTGEQQPLACTQFHHLMEGRDLLRAGSLGEYRKNPSLFQENEEEVRSSASLYPGFKYDGYAWGMAIDINSCIGCNACVVACVAENNSPVVGKREVLRGREMHWIRVDRYYKGGLENPQMYHQPVPCMHCENAPCELVCPVGATSHSHEGLNDMVYNRCVGTRYCSNNCPYKVRRFNFFLYSDFQTPSLKPLRNPDVTVRSRGVMEKCTYCVQRINQAKINAEKENRLVRDGEIVTACQQACPTQAIVFGNVNDPNSGVSKLKAGSLNYTLLTELNTKPRTSYQAKLNNPNPEIEDT